jgi:hypothetical protein
MITITDIYQLKARVHRLKHDLNSENRSWQEKEFANKYLNKVLDYIDELTCS